MPSDDDSPEDEEAGIPCESWIPSRLRDLAKNARVLLNPDRTDGQDDDVGSVGESGDVLSAYGWAQGGQLISLFSVCVPERIIARYHPGLTDDVSEHSEHGKPGFLCTVSMRTIQCDSAEDEHDHDQMADILQEDKHLGEFDDAPEIEEEDYDSDTPLAKHRHIAGRVDADPRSEYPKASRIREHVEGKRPRITDYEPDARHVLVQAVRIFKSLVSTENAYPDKLTELTWAKQAWWEAADDLEVELAPNRECVKIVGEFLFVSNRLITLLLDHSLFVALARRDKDGCTQPCRDGVQVPPKCSGGNPTLESRACGGTAQE